MTSRCYHGNVLLKSSVALYQQPYMQTDRQRDRQRDRQTDRDNVHVNAMKQQCNVDQLQCTSRQDVYISLSTLHSRLICGYKCSPGPLTVPLRLQQRRNHVFKVGGPIPWSRVLLPFYRKKIRQVYPVWCIRLHNHTLFIKKLRNKLGSVQILGRSGPTRPPSGCAHGLVHLRGVRPEV